VVTQVSRLACRQAYRKLCIRFNLELSRHTTPHRCWAVEQGSVRWKLTKIGSKTQLFILVVSCLREDWPALAEGKHYSCANMALSNRGGKSKGCKQFTCVDYLAGPMSPLTQACIWYNITSTVSMGGLVICHTACQDESINHNLSSRLACKVATRTRTPCRTNDAQYVDTTCKSTHSQKLAQALSQRHLCVQGL